MPSSTPDYEKLSTEELVRERDALDALIQDRRESEKQALLAEFRERARALGLDFDDLSAPRQGGSRAGQGGQGRGAKRGKVRPKYRHPDDPSKLWTGRGRKPKWVEAELEAGKHLDDLLIEPAATA